MRLKDDIMELFRNELSLLTKYFAHPQKITILPHKDPDGDAIGACLGWYNVLIAVGHDVVVISPDEVPENLRWMPGAAHIVTFSSDKGTASDRLAKSELLLLLDFNDLKRVGELANVVRTLDIPRVNIDHHPYPDTAISQVLISDTGASSTCELSFKVMKGLGYKPGIESAVCLYSGIMTDTGMLNHNSSNPGLYRIIAELLEAGIDKDSIHKELFHSNSLSRTRLMGHALGNKLQVISSGRVAYIALSAEELRMYEYKPGDTEGLVNMPLSVKGIVVSILLTERKEGFVKLSFRSRGGIAINAYSTRYFSGGGHSNAAGGEFVGSLDDAVSVICSTIGPFLDGD